MLKKVLFVALIFSSKLFAQSPIKSDSLVFTSLDSLLLKLDSVYTPKSYLNIDFGIGNREFSLNNNAINANQSVVSQLYYTPSINYFHKSGFSISLTPYFTNINGGLNLYQTALSPAYGFENKKISATLSATHYFADNKVYNGNSTFQNELYLSLKYKKTVLQPIFTAGLAGGNFREINLDSVRIAGVKRYILDSTQNNIKTFEVSIGVEHDFEFESFFHKKDFLSITPQLFLNAGSEKYTSTHINKLFAKAVNRGNKVRSLTSTDNAPFSVQSLAFSLILNYEIGSFYIMPNFYTDYYLKTTTGKRLNSVFGISFGYNF